MVFRSKKMSIIFMGSCSFSLSVLSYLEKRFPISAVYTAPPRPKGRGHKVQETCVHHHAQQKGYLVLTPTHFRDSDSVQAFYTLQPTVAIVASYGLILPQSILDIPKKGCVNVHPSLLPRWRGSSPVVSSLLAGDTKTGVSIMVMDAGMDTGPLLFQESVDIPHGIQADTLSDLLAQKGSQSLIRVLSPYLEGHVEPTPQESAGALIAKKIEKRDGVLRWSQGADALVRKVNALVGWPGTWGQFGPFSLKVLGARAIGPVDCDGRLGDLLSFQGQAAVLCAERSAFIPLKVQTLQGKTMAMDDFVRGHPPLLAKARLLDETGRF